MIYYQKWTSPLTDLHLYADDDHLLAVAYTENQRAIVRRLGITTTSAQPSPIIKQAINQLSEYFAGQRQEFRLPLKLQGTEFQQRAWSELTRIPFGKTISYSEQARKIKKASAVRAIGSANGRNPLSIIVPCHRVIAQNKSISGYAGGAKLKQKLLALEGITL